jgi:heptosyltransferase-2
MQNSRAILIVAPAWLGDMVMAHTLIQLLHERYPQVHIDLLAPAATAPIGSRLPGVRDVYELVAGHGELALGERWRCARVLSALNYDQAIVLPNSFKSVLVPLWAGIRRRTGWTGESRIGVLNDRRTLNAAHYPLMIERFMALGLDPGVLLDRPYPQPRLDVDSKAADALQAEFQLADTGAIALCPGAEFGPAKRWPPEYFAALARMLVSKGHQIWLLGAMADRPVCAEIESRVPNGVVNLAGKTRLTDVVDLLSRVEGVVSNDSGLMHVAAALQKPLVAVYGSTSPDFTPPLSDQARVLRVDLDCAPCFQRECPLKHLNCLKQLTPDQVLNALGEVGV